MRGGPIPGPGAVQKNPFPRRVAALLLAAGSLFVTGCQSVPALNRPVYVTPIDPTQKEGSGQSAGVDVPFGSATFGITCATESVGDSTRGTAALMCTWKTATR
jgi:hypothetical protein